MKSIANFTPKAEERAIKPYSEGNLVIEAQSYIMPQHFELSQERTNCHESISHTAAHKDAVATFVSALKCNTNQKHNISDAPILLKSIKVEFS